MSRRTKPPEIAYSWPMIPLVATLGVLSFSQIAAYCCIAGAFLCCPIRDAILKRWWGA